MESILSSKGFAHAQGDLNMAFLHMGEDKQSKKKISLNIWFLDLSEESRRNKTDFELAMVNEPSVFELLRFDCTYIWRGPYIIPLKSCHELRLVYFTNK